MAQRILPKHILLYRSQSKDQLQLKRLLIKWQIEAIEVSVFAEFRQQEVLENLPAAIAIVSEDDPAGIDFLRSVMHANTWTQRILLSASPSIDLYEKAVNKAHINYMIKLPLEAGKLHTYLIKAHRRFQNLIRPFAKFDALTAVTEDLLLDNEKYRVEATTDALTRLMNRRSFNNILQRLWQRYSQQNLQFSITLIDIDHFKKVNDSYGHAAGDVVLQAISGILLNNQRVGMDYAFRYGGEEFAIIATNTNAEEMQAYIKRILNIVTGTRINYQDQEISVTFSAGICQTSENVNAEQMISNADAALYQAKEAGRNGIRIWNES